MTRQDARRRPVVLMHGFGAFVHLFAPISLTPLVEALRRRGIDVHAPKVEPYGPIEARVAGWEKKLLEIRAESGAEEFHLIGFSSGGLDARYLVSRSEGHAFVRTVTTVSTPHRGSSIARSVLDQPDVLRKSLTGLADWMGRTMHQSPSDARRALEQLTPEYLESEFNPQVEDHPSVRYESWAARAGLGTDVSINPILRPTNKFLFETEGINDGIVSVESSVWTGFKGTIDADHGRMVGLKAWNGSFEPAPFIYDLVQRFESENY